jgi:hypothetical protein
MTDTALYYALSTIAQCAAALAALIGFLGMRRLDRLRDEVHQHMLTLYRLIGGRESPPSDYMIVQSAQDLIKSWGNLSRDQQNIMPPHEGAQARRGQEELAYKNILQEVQRRLMIALRIFLAVTLFILLAAIVGFPFVDQAKNWGGTPWLLGFAGICLVWSPLTVAWVASRLPHTIITLALLLALASPALAGPVRCTTYEEKTLGRLQTLCDDGSRAISRYNTTLDRWETIVSAPPPDQTCRGRLNPTIRQWEGSCR